MFKKILLGLSYVAGAVIVIGGTFLLVAYGKGYSYDWKTHRLIHNGLVLLESTPSGATVTVDGKDVQRKSPYRKTFEAGGHTFILQKDGYQPWHKIINVLASQVSLAQYVLLFPTNMKATTLATHPQIGAVAVTKDHRRIAYVVPTGVDAGLWVLDTGNSKRTKVYAARTTTEGTEQITGLQWAEDNSHLLAQATLAAVATNLLISTNTSEASINVTALFPTATNLVINPLNWHELYFTDAAGLQRLDVGAKSSITLVKGTITSFNFAGDRVVYVESSSAQPGLWMLDRAGHRQLISSSLPASPGYDMAYGVYLGVGQLAVIPSSTGNAVLFTDPFSEHVTSQTVLIGVQQPSFSPDGHFLLGCGPSTIQTYDVEKHQSWRFAPAPAPYVNVSWLDSFHILYDRDGSSVVSEFDGENTTTLLKASGLPALISADGKTVYGFALSGTTTQVTSLKIRQ